MVIKVIIKIIYLVFTILRCKPSTLTAEVENAGASRKSKWKESQPFGSFWAYKKFLNPRGSVLATWQLRRAGMAGHL
jgi:hypothetical protein